jgi:hypothetical protein
MPLSTSNSNGGEKMSSQSKTIFDQIKDVQEQNSRYAKVEVGQKWIFEFDVNKIAIVDTEFQGQKKKRVRFEVIDPNKPFESKILELSPTHATQLGAFLERSDYLVEITRLTGGRDTKYTASSPLGERNRFSPCINAPLVGFRGILSRYLYQLSERCKGMSGILASWDFYHVCKSFSIDTQDR